MKNICFFSGDITRSGGTERVSIRIANALAKQKDISVSFVSLVELEKKPFFAIHESISRYTLGKRWINPSPGYLKILPKLRRFLKEKQFDVIIDIDIVLDVLSIPAVRGLKTKVVSWEHFNYGFETSVFYRKLILKYTAKRSDYVVTLTEGDRQSYERNQGRQKDICVIPNPIEPIEYRGNTKKEKQIITVGRLTSIKGMDYLAETAAIVLKKCPDWQWIVLGEGEERSYLEEFIERHGLGRQLILAGKVADVNSYLEKAQIFALTSRSEGFPMCLLEAKVQHLPCVSFHIGAGVVEMIADGTNGYLVPAYDCQEMAEKLIRLIQDEKLRAEFSGQAALHLEKYSIETILEKWNEVLEKLCG